MRRRTFIAFCGGAVAWPLAVAAQERDRIRRIGMLTGLPENDSEGQSLLAAFRRQLTELGWIEGQNVRTEVRWANADPERIRSYGLELARMMPDVIVVHGPRALTAVRQWTDHIPIVFASVSDPLSSGYVASLARPGGNVTGFAVYVGVPAPKLLQMLVEIAPNVRQVGLMMRPDNPGVARQLHEMETAPLAAKSIPMLISDPAAIAPTIAAFAQEPDRGLVVTTDVFMVAHRDVIIAEAARHRLPAVYQDRSFVEKGGLMSYGVDRRETYRQAATYVDRILKGAQPAELPVQQPAKTEFVLNLKTAKALNLSLSKNLLARADELIE